MASADADDPTTDGASTISPGVGDPLSEIGARAGLSPATIDALTRWLAEQAEVDRFAQLERAGHSIEERIPLARVFVDLQVHDHRGRSREFLGYLNQPRSARHEPSIKPPPPPPWFHEPAGKRRSEDGAFDSASTSKRVEGYALIGGPGQGKTTLGQLLCQLHRAWLLRPRIDTLATNSQRDAVEAFTEDRAVKDLGRPAELRLPIRIPLADAASWLAKRDEADDQRDPLALFSYLKESLACPVTPTELRRVFSSSDSLLVLDGLDEVPPSADRGRLLAACRALLVNISAGGGHGLLLATTRPQGYSGDYEDLDVELRSCTLVPFDEERSLAYARRLVEARFAADRRDKVLHRLEQAAQGETTARLMSTPLQVTILATLVDRIGRAPSEQWTLFREYYRVIYEREMERPFEAAEVLREYRRYVDKIHTHIGLLLQVEAVQAGGTESALTRQRFRHVVDAVLAEDEIEGGRRRGLVSRIDNALRERLVLLIDRGQDQLGFEIRSIQEFMAAWALSQKGEAIVEQRIKEIAKVAGFRNVVLFLASRAFTDTDVTDLRDALVDRICPDLNNDPEDRLSRAALAGSVLALEICEEGSALKQDKYVRKLGVLATQLLEFPSSSIHQRLARVCLKDEDARQVAMPILQAAISERIRMPEPSQRLGAWVALLTLADAGEDWAAELAEKCWHDPPPVVDELLSAIRGDDLPVGSWLWSKLWQAPEQFDPYVIGRLVANFDPTDSTEERVVLLMGALLRRRGAFELDVLCGGVPSPLSLKLVPIAPWRPLSFRALATMPTSHPRWQPWIAAARFFMEPTARTLGEELGRLVGIFDRGMFAYVADYLPWPLGACVGAAESAEALRSLADDALAGVLGDAEEWLAAESRWRSGRIELMDVVRPAGSTWPYGPGLFERGVPLAAAGFWWSMPLPLDDGEDWLLALRAEFDRGRHPIVRAKIAKFIGGGLQHVPRRRKFEQGFPPEDIRAIYTIYEGAFPLQALIAIEPWEDVAQEGGWATVLDEMGRARSPGVAGSDVASLKLFTAFISHLYVREPSRSGLLNILRGLATIGGRPSVPRELIFAHAHQDAFLNDSAALVLLASGQATHEEAAKMAAAFAQSSNPHSHPAKNLLEVVEHMQEDPTLIEIVLAALWAHAPPGDDNFRWMLTNAITDFVARRPSTLSDPAVWDRLHLPLPRPERRKPSDLPPPPSEHPRLQLGSITLQNLRAFEDFSLIPAEPPADAGHWVVLLGENGMGKTTILRSLVFALVDVTSQPNRLPRSAFETPWRRRGTDKDMPSAVQATLNGTSYRTTITSDPDRADKERLLQGTAFPSSPIFAYGCRRGSALGGGTRKVDVDPGAEIPTLFDEGADLIHAETWLLLREGAAMKDKAEDGPAWRIYQAILQALVSILPGIDLIEVRGDRVWVRGPKIGEVPLEALSDGYLTTLGWVIDLLARWIKRAEIRKDPIGADFTRSMTGLVLVDEIDLHLHPEWQRSVIEKVRGIFPRMSFIVTTHNPLTLLGARAEDIWKLTRTESGRIIPVQGRARPALMTSSEILESYFDIRTLFPDELGEMLNRYGFLARDTVRTDEEDGEMRDLLAKLRERGVEPGFQPVPREEIPPYPGDPSA